MYKSLKRIVLLLAFVCVTLGLSVFALACNPEQDNGPEISAEYQALYEQYKEAAGENAKTLQDWYEALSADIEKIGDMGDIADMDVIEIENVNYVALTYENGRLFLEELLNGESFKEYSVFTLSPNAADQATITGIYLDVNRKGTSGALEKVRSVRTGADGKVIVYLETDGQATYVVTIGEQSAEAYGFAPGYEPEFSGSQETKTVTFGVQTASQKVTYSAQVVYRAEDYAPTKDVKLSLRYVESDKASLTVVGEGTTGEDGKVEISFYAHEDSKYEFVLDETSLTPDKYEPVEGPIEVDPEEEETVFTLIRLKNYTDPETLTPSGTPAKAEDPEDREAMELTVPKTGELETLFQYNAETDTYTYLNSSDSANNGKQLFVAMDFFLARVHGEKTIKQLLEEGGYFTYEECVDEDQNTWAQHDYSQVLEAYMEYVTESGVYPLNQDLYNFITSAAENGLFAEKTTDGKYDLFMPLVVYSDLRLIVDKEYTTSIKTTNDWYYWSRSVTRIVVPFMQDMEEGWYKLKVNSDKFETSGNTAKYARLGGFTSEKNGIFEFGRNFTLNKVDGDSGYNFEGAIYIGAGAKEMHLLCGSFYRNQGPYNLKLNLTKITAEDGTVVNAAGEEVDLSALAGKKQQILSPDKSEYEVLVYPENVLEQHTEATDTNEKNFLSPYTNISTFGYTFDSNRMFVKYTVTPTVGNIEGLKIHTYQMLDTKSGSGSSLTSTVNLTYDKKEISGETTNCEVTAGRTSQNPWFDGVMFTHTGEGILTMKIKLEAVNTQFTVTYKAGEGKGEDYTYGNGGTSFHNLYTYYAENAQVTMADNTNAKLGYTRDGYVFNGWSYEDAEGETQIVKPGDKVTMLNHDMVFTAVWREESVNSKNLAAGGDIEVEFDSEKYTAVEINLADTVAENKGYTLTMTMGEEEWKNLNLIYGDYTILPLATETSETAHKYVAYFIKLGDADKIVIDISKVSVNFTATFALEEYTPVVLKDDGETEVIVPIYDRAFVENSISDPDSDEEIKTNVLYTELDPSMRPTTTTVHYNFKVTDSAIPMRSNGVYLMGDLEGDDDGASFKYTQNLSSSSKVEVLLSAGVTKLHFDESMSQSNKYFGALKLKIARLYTVTYESSDEDVQNYQVSKTPATDSGVYEKNASVTLKTPSDTAAYGFVHWIKKGDSSGTTYAGSSTYTITEDVTFVAVWRKLNPMEQTLRFVNTTDPVEGETEMTIDPDVYTSFKINLTNCKNEHARGIKLLLDLGTSDFKGEMRTKEGYFITHSDALSTKDHNIYAAFVRKQSDSYYTGSTTTFTVDLSAWKTAGNPRIEHIKVSAMPGSKVSGFSYGGEYFEKKEDGKLWANVGVNNKGYVDWDTACALPNTVESGKTYKVHVRFNIADPKTSIKGLKILVGSNYNGITMTYDEDSKEFIYNSWADTTSSRYIRLQVDSSVKDFYTCDVWLEEVG